MQPGISRQKLFPHGQANDNFAMIIWIPYITNVEAYVLASMKSFLLHFCPVACVFASAAHPAAAANGSYGHYGNSDEEWDDGFPPPPSPRSVQEMGRDFPLTPSQPRYSPA